MTDGQYLANGLLIFFAVLGVLVWLGDVFGWEGDHDDPTF